MEFVDRINAEYGEFPDQGEIARRGNSYLKENFPNLSYLSSVAIVPTENGADVSMVPRQLPPPPPPQQQSSFEFAFPLVILLLVVLGSPWSSKSSLPPAPRPQPRPGI
ncbi:hypothetical protein BASA81_006202 [Batrachochytrium salamandrivorans]|nr:hypothetical protein BASA81_006202 [Batrachochytrium salamandrivorans]